MGIFSLSASIASIAALIYSFDEISNTEIKFKIDTDYVIAPDYAIRKILGVDPASDANIIYEAGKNIYKSFESAGELGKEIGENADNLRF